MSTPEVGKNYKVIHSRKGTFYIKVTKVADTWVTGELYKGETETLLEENSKGTGEHVTVRAALCEFSRDIPTRNPKGIQ